MSERARPFFPFRGGLDQETPAIAIPPGRVIAALNHECEALGYKRTEGYERFDGRFPPSEVVAYTGSFDEGTFEPNLGHTMVGNLSGATGTLISLTESTTGSGTWFNNKETGTFVLANVDGTFLNGEGMGIVELGGGFAFELNSDVELVDPLASAEDLAIHVTAVEAVRAEIEEVPGSGPVRGIVWYADKLTAWRDNDDATYCVPWDSSATGWTAKDLGWLLHFTDGGPYPIAVGDTIEGDGSASTATVLYVGLDSGDWADSDAAGYLVIGETTGIGFSNETLSVGINIGIAQVQAAAQEMTFPPGGRYEFEITNFYATESYERVYGVNGVGPAFEYDGTYFAPITTGASPDTPFLIAEHKGHLFLAFTAGSLQHSEGGLPRQWSGTFGAAELGLGHEITNLITTETMLLASTDKSVQMLTGNDTSDWLLQPVSKSAGAKRYTAARVGEVIYLDDRGVRSVASSQSYGNFKLGVFTSLINKLLDAKRRAGIFPVGSCVVKTKSQYLLFFDDGSGVSIFFGVKQPEAMPFLYPFVVSCLHVAEIDGVERVFAGATNGFVYELNKGTSFDGAEIEAYLQLPFMHHGDPSMLKRWHSMELEVYGQYGTELGVITQFDGGSGEQPFNQEGTIDILGGGGLWGLVTWGEFVWSSPQIGQSSLWLDGAGFSMSPILVSRSSTISSYTIAGATVVFSGRGRKR